MRRREGGDKGQEGDKGEIEDVHCEEVEDVHGDEVEDVPVRKLKTFTVKKATKAREVTNFMVR